jgi:adenine deaminase
VNRENLAAQVKQLVDLIAAGGNVVTGTDSPIDHTAVSTHMNLRAMVKYGVTPYQALVSATSEPGRYLNEPLGQIAPGMLADLSFLGGNPLDDIGQAANVQQVMVNGFLHTPDDLLAPFAAPAANAKAKSSTKNRLLAPVPTPSSEARYWWHDPHYLEESKRSCCAG